MKEVKELNRVIAKMADLIKGQRKVKLLKIPPAKKVVPNRTR